MQFALGQQTAALISMQQVVQVERQLASQYPASFLPDLAAGLDNLSGCHLEVAQPEMAVAVCLGKPPRLRAGWRKPTRRPRVTLSCWPRRWRRSGGPSSSAGTAPRRPGRFARPSRSQRESAAADLHVAKPALLKTLLASLDDATAPVGEGSRCFPQ